MAAARSTWSPCGLSMLSTITPFGERGKGHRYAATCTWFVLGATAGGLALGAVAAGLAALVAASGASALSLGVAALVAVLVAGVSDTGVAGARLPVHYRQVNERWLDAYRPWVYGSGFGFQIGCGLATYITTAAVYLTVVLAALTAGPAVALVVGVAFGLVRGLAVTLTRHVRSPGALLSFHQRFAALLPWADRAVLATLILAAVGLALMVGAVPATVALLAVGAGAATVRLVAQSPSAAAVGTASDELVSAESVTDETVADTASPSTPGDAVPSAVPSGAGAVAGAGSGRLSRQRREGPSREASTTRPTTDSVRPAACVSCEPSWPISPNHRCSSRKRSMPHSTMPTPSTMPAGARGAAAAAMVDPSEAMDGVLPRSHRSTRRRMPKMAKSSMAWKIGTGRTF
ncbi:MAG TPA: hypothetical protein VF279_07615, partial [Acidimicrobiales bacterium]